MRKSLSENLVQAQGLVKTFGAFRALDGLDLHVAEGEVHGFLGPNGSGKSTTIRALLGQLRLNEGQADVFGLHPWRDSVEIHGRLAYVPGDTSCGQDSRAVNALTCWAGSKAAWTPSAAMSWWRGSNWTPQNVPAHIPKGTGRK